MPFLGNDHPYISLLNLQSAALCCRRWKDCKPSASVLFHWQESNVDVTGFFPLTLSICIHLLTHLSLCSLFRSSLLHQVLLSMVLFMLDILLFSSLCYDWNQLCPALRLHCLSCWRMVYSYGHPSASLSPVFYHPRLALFYAASCLSTSQGLCYCTDLYSFVRHHCVRVVNNSFYTEKKNACYSYL